MKLITVIDEDFVNYKIPSMFISTDKCFRNCAGCHNQHLKNPALSIYIDNNYLIRRYLDNPITKAIVLGGLDPLDNFYETYGFYKELRKYCQDTVIIYTGHTKDDAKEAIEMLIKEGGPLIVKYGCYIEGHEPHYDEVLGVILASDNQFAEEYNVKNKKKY